MSHRLMNYEDTKLKQAVGDVFRGTCGGITLTLVGHPFDTVKIRLVTQPQPPNTPIYSGAIDCVKKTYQWEGIRGFYKGVASPIAGQMFFNAVKFMTYGQAQLYVKKVRKVETMGPIEYFMAGAVAQAVGAVIEGPVDFFKSQMQVQIIKSKTIPGYVPEFTGVWDAAKKITARNGIIAGSYQGFQITVLRNVLCGATYLMVFETLRMERAKFHKCTVKELPILETFVCGGISGFFYWAPYYPIDVIKSSIQSDSYIKEDRKYSGIVDAAKKIYAASGLASLLMMALFSIVEGIKGFYRGFVPCMARSFPANATLLATVFHVC